MGLEVNAVTYIGMVMSIGLLVDFVMHILLRYYESSGTREEKTVNTLRTMGSSIFLGGLSSLLGTLGLSFASSSIFTSVFVVFFGLVVLGVLHGLIFLPIVLSQFGPEDPPTNVESQIEKTSQQAIQEGAP
jgi:Niemann-Pick C1 protein